MRAKFGKRRKVASPSMLPEPPRCEFPRCQEWSNHRHHVTYNPEVVKLLCFEHHEQITMLDGQQSRKYHYVKLSNKHRWKIWYLWTEGKLKPRCTRKALEWTESSVRPADPFEQNGSESEPSMSATPVVEPRKTPGPERKPRAPRHETQETDQESK